MDNNLIVLEQLPIITEKLDKISKEVSEKVDKLTSLVCTEDTVKEVKSARAELNKEFNELETQRKNVKNAIMDKYNAFEEIYKEKVANLYKQADIDLKAKIDNVENDLKKQKEEELREFVKQHCDDNNVHIDFERIGLNITLSASMKSLKEQALAFIERVVNDLKLIEMENFRDEILYEYNQNFNFVDSKTIVLERHKALDEIKEQEEVKEIKEQEDQKVEEVIEEITAPKEIIEDTDIITVQFTVTSTKEKILKLKEYLQTNEISYE